MLTAGGIAAFWPNPEKLPTSEVRGCFSATRHGGDDLGEVLPTTGRVLGLLLQTVEFRHIDRVWEPVPCTEILRRIAASPKWFARDLHISSYIETGVVMELAVNRRPATVR